MIKLLPLTSPYSRTVLNFTSTKQFLISKHIAGRGSKYGQTGQAWDCKFFKDCNAAEESILFYNRDSSLAMNDKGFFVLSKLLERNSVLGGGDWEEGRIRAHQV